MAATPYAENPRQKSYLSLLLGMLPVAGRYIGLRTTLTFALETLWLVGSSLALAAFSQLDSYLPFNGLLIVDQAALLTAIYLLVFYLMNLYDLDLVTPRRFLLINLTQALGLVCILVGLADTRQSILRFPPLLLLAHAGMTAVVVVLSRELVDRLVSAKRPLARIGFIGSDSARAEAERQQGDLLRLGFGVEFLAKELAQVEKQVRRSGLPTGIHRLVVDDSELRRPEAGEFLSECAAAGVTVEELTNFRERVLGKIRLGPELAHELAFSQEESHAVIFLRRAQDIVLASLGLLLALPVAVPLALAIKCDSPGPVLFWQDRIGKNRRSFRMYKFRSMHTGTPVVDGAAWTTHAGDPRITRVGRIIRKFHLDEIPQLINVIKGDMSLVGPRPFHPQHFAQLESAPYFSLRQLVLPGITGWAQIRCDYAASVENHEEVLARDLYYVKHASFLLNLLIIADTLRICLWRRGAR